MIEIKSLTYTYPQSATSALRDVSLRVDAGEFVLVTGPSGCGKSTLLRCLNGLVPHFSGGRLSGHIRVAGQDPVAAGPEAMSRRAGFVLQSPEAQAVLDRVEPEIAFGLENAAVPRPEMRRRVAEVMEWLELMELRERPLITLSGGERQRTAIAGVLALQPPLLILDEPTSQLDPAAAADLLARLVELNRAQDLTIILAEHRLERILPYATRVVHLEEGRIHIDAPPQEAAARLPQPPPVVRVAQARGWRPLPLTVEAARRFVTEKELISERAEGAEEIEETPHAVAHRRRDENPQTATQLHSPFPIPQSPLLQVEGVSFAYEGRAALQDVSLAVEGGTAVALLGDNGAGKSTLLRCVIGLLEPDHGSIRLCGEAIQGGDVAEIATKIGYLPQNPDDLLFAETAAAELAATLRNHGRDAAAADVNGRLAQLGLAAEQINAYPRDLSVGQRQRVALGAVTVTDPPLLLLDEPTRGLDYAAKAALVRIWRRWLDEGRGLLLVTHDVELVAQIAERVVIVEEGGVVDAGETAVVLRRHPRFTPQIARLFPHTDWLTSQQAIKG